jgi:hypothetical protein
MKSAKQKSPSEQRFSITFESVPVQRFRGELRRISGVDYHFSNIDLKTIFFRMHQAPDAISNAIGYAKFRSRSHDAVIRVFDEAGNGLDEADLYWGRIATQHWQ